MTYIGGFFDGEGCFALCKKGDDAWFISVSVAQCNRPILEAIQNTLGCGGGLYERKFSGTGEKKVYELIYTYGAALEAAKKLAPYVIMKRPQAEVLIEYCEKYGSFLKHTKGLTEEQKTARHVERNAAAEAARQRNQIRRASI